MSDAKRTIIVDLLRHGEPEGGDILRGRINPKLTPLGWRQMSASTGLSLEPEAAYAAELGVIAPVYPTPLTPRWTKVISSPLERCQHFAAHAAAAHALTPRIDDTWQEIDYGDWDGMPIDEWRRLAAPQFAEFRRDLSKLTPPNGEGYLDFKDRILSAWSALTDEPDGGHVLVVTHGGVLRVVLPTVLGMPLNRSFPLHIPFASFSRVRLDVAGEKVSATLLFHNAAEYPSS
jgi:broad specificity phosphatase PhoE